MAPAVVQMRTPAETALIERFEAEKGVLPGAAAERAAAFERFKARGLPSKRVEAYHYTDLRTLMRQAPGTAGAALPLPEAPAGVTVHSLAEALAGGFRPGTAMGQAEDVVVDLNTALMREGMVIRVAAGTVLADPLVLDVVQNAASRHDRVIVEIGAGAEVTLVERHSGPDGTAYQSNHVVELILGAGAKVEHVRVNAAGNEALVLSTLAASLAEEAELMSLNFSVGGAVARHQSFITYAGENAKLDLRGATMIRGRQHCDNTLVVDHAVPHGTSRELFRTVADDEAHGIFQGKIIVRPHAQKTDGQMASNALLLGDEAAMSNKPELEIFADDVVCAHGATCGALEESQLFYLMARGLPRPEAEALLVEAFLGEVLEAVSDDTLRDELAGRISTWLAARQAA
ncbi:MAG: Fe-S cluster assembly protein SufD [Beijerinckiaceae bacterium]|nr:Fe-S cluster assembly protein SufD [Beijerinckiaceae bacterium]